MSEWEASESPDGGTASPLLMPNMRRQSNHAASHDELTDSEGLSPRKEKQAQDDADLGAAQRRKSGSRQSEAQRATPSEGSASGKPHREAEMAAKSFDSEELPVALLEASLTFWCTISEDDRSDFYEHVQKFYHSILEEFRVAANASVTSFKQLQRKNFMLRLLVIVLTGGLAILNVILAFRWPSPSNPTTSLSLNQVLSLVAAIYASILAILANVESFLKYPDQKAAFRESRELYLDNYRRFEMMWLLRVHPFGYSPDGCFNAAAAYRQLVAKDLELRRKIMNLSETRPRTGGSKEQ